MENVDSLTIRAWLHVWLSVSVVGYIEFSRIALDNWKCSFSVFCVMYKMLYITNAIWDTHHITLLPGAGQCIYSCIPSINSILHSISLDTIVSVPVPVIVIVTDALLRYPNAKICRHSGMRSLASEDLPTRLSRPLLRFCAGDTDGTIMHCRIVISSTYSRIFRIG